jgi:hypothetical protein
MRSSWLFTAGIVLALTSTPAVAELVDLGIGLVTPHASLRRGGDCNEIDVEVFNNGPDGIVIDEPGLLTVTVLDTNFKEHWTTPSSLYTEVRGIPPGGRQTYTLSRIEIPTMAVINNSVKLKFQVHASGWHIAGETNYSNNVKEVQYGNVGSCTGGGGPGGNEPMGDNEDLAERAFNEAYSVFSHERCTNCHAGTTLSPRHNPTMIAGRPISSGDCYTCHHVPSSTEPIAGSGRGGPVPLSAHPTWHMAPTMPQDMAFLNMGMPLSAHDLCEKVRRNTGLGDNRAAATEVANHAERDDLVEWAFDPKCSDAAGTATVPCAGRTPAPGSHRAFVDKLREWAGFGGFCP